MKDYLEEEDRDELRKEVNELKHEKQLIEEELSIEK